MIKNLDAAKPNLTIGGLHQQYGTKLKTYTGVNI